MPADHLEVPQPHPDLVADHRAQVRGLRIPQPGAAPVQLAERLRHDVAAGTQQHGQLEQLTVVSVEQRADTGLVLQVT
jgi:hypothetical protein